MSALDTPDRWVGSLSMAAAVAVRQPERHAKQTLKRTLDEFLRSQTPSQELRDMLRQELRR